MACAMPTGARGSFAGESAKGTPDSPHSPMNTALPYRKRLARPDFRGIRRPVRMVQV
jgi:hypothetical protein